MLDNLLDLIGRALEGIAATLSMENGYFWLVVGLVLIIFESLGAALALASLGMGALLTSIAAFCGLLGLHGLIIVFVLLSIAIFAGSRPLARRLGGRRGKKGEHDTNIDGLVGRAAVVTQEIGGHHKPGYVKVGGEEWRAIPVQDSAIPAGTMVQVTKVEGATLTVMQNPIEEGGES